MRLSDKLILTQMYGRPRSTWPPQWPSALICPVVLLCDPPAWHTQGHNILIVDEVDDTRKTLSYAVLELNKVGHREGDTPQPHAMWPRVRTKSCRPDGQCVSPGQRVGLGSCHD